MCKRVDGILKFRNNRRHSDPRADIILHLFFMAIDYNRKGVGGAVCDTRRVAGVHRIKVSSDKPLCKVSKLISIYPIRVFSGGDHVAAAGEHDAICANRHRVGRTAAEASCP